MRDKTDIDDFSVLPVPDPLTSEHSSQNAPGSWYMRKDG